MKRIFSLTAVLVAFLPAIALAQLKVHSARWEVAGGGAACDATAQLSAACNGFRNCNLRVDPANLCNGDPAFGQLKVLDINYSCDGRRQSAIGFADGMMASLRCERPRRGKPVLQIRSARWEVIGGGQACDALPQISAACNGQEACQVYVDPRYVCGVDPAFGKQKRLDIQYSCNGQPQTPLGFVDGSLALLRCDGRSQAPGTNHYSQSNVAQTYPVRPTVEMPPPVHHGHNQHLQILAARWEVIGGGPWCDAAPQLSRSCNGRNYCQIPVDPSNLCNGDPAVGRLKRVDVKYSCNGVVQPVLGFQDGSTISLRCGDGHAVNPAPVRGGAQHLQITSARWEVNGGGAWCDATPQMAGSCNGRQFCQVPVDPRNLCNGDPAPGKYKTLEVRYTCNGRPQSTMGFPDGSQAVLRCE